MQNLGYPLTYYFDNYAERSDEGPRLNPDELAEDENSMTLIPELGKDLVD
jgi:hypothetical protein